MRRRLAGSAVRMLTAVAVILVAAGTAGCARNKLLLDLYGSVVYEKPQIAGVSHTVRDDRAEGGTAVVRVAIVGDPGLAATFDIYPGIVDRYPMVETEAGNYVGEFQLQRDLLGGTFTITGRLEHPEAGEVLRRDDDPLIIRRVQP